MKTPTSSRSVEILRIVMSGAPSREFITRDAMMIMDKKSGRGLGEYLSMSAKSSLRTSSAEP